MAKVDKKNFKEDSTKVKTAGKKNRGNDRWRNKGKSVKGRNEADPTEKETYSTNDISWYAHYPELMRDAASINWNTLMGVPVRETPNPATDATLDISSLPSKPVFSPAGLAIVRVSPAFGFADSELDPINVAAIQGYGNIRSANSGSTNYNATDWMIHMLGVADCYSIINYMIRLYSLYRVYNVQNKYWPKAILEAEGFNLDQLNREGAAWRFAINALIPKVASVAVPAVFDLFRRRAFMFSNIYTEGDVVKDQLYMFEPYSFCAFELDAQGAGMLKSYDFDTKVPIGTDGYRDIWDLYKWAEELASNFFSDESTGTITGDILKAFGDNIIKLSPIPEDLFIVPVKDYITLEQIHNCTMFPSILPGSLDVTQVVLGPHSGYLKFTPQIPSQPLLPEASSGMTVHYYGHHLMDAKQLLTVNASDPGPDMNMEITRLHAMVDSSSQPFWTIRAGSEIVRSIHLVQIYDEQQKAGSTILCPVLSIDNDPANAYIRYLNLIQSRQFHYLPEILVMLVVPGNNPSDPPIVLYEDRSIELTNWTLVTGDVIDRLHYTALSSMVYVQPNAFYPGKRG